LKIRTGAICRGAKAGCGSCTAREGHALELPALLASAFRRNLGNRIATEEGILIQERVPDLVRAPAGALGRKELKADELAKDIPEGLR